MLTLKARSLCATWMSSCFLTVMMHTVRAGLIIAAEEYTLHVRCSAFGRMRAVREQIAYGTAFLSHHWQYIHTTPIIKSYPRLIQSRPQFDILSNICIIPRNELHQHDRASRTLAKDRGACQGGQQSPDANGTARSCRRTTASC